MADVNLQCGFFNANMVNGSPDRTYNADNVNKFFEGLVSKDGVFESISTACQVVQSTGMKVIVKAGKGSISHHWFWIDNDKSLTIDSADVILDRIDAVVVRLKPSERIVTLTVKQGELATKPVPPTLTRDGETYEIALAHIKVGKNITAIDDSMITDTRPNNEWCGWIVGIIEQMDTTTLFNQYQKAQDNFINNQSKDFNAWLDESTKAFDKWFETTKNTIRASSLYREYSEKYTTTKASESIFKIPTSILYDNVLDILNIYINGFKIGKDEFSIDSSGTHIALTYPLDVAGTEIEFVNKKSVEDAVAESTVSRVEALETKVNAITNTAYNCTGTDDNVAISNMVKQFLDGTEEFSGVADNASLYISVVGNLGIASLIEDSLVFDFDSSTDSNRRIFIDFARATIPPIAMFASSLAIFSAGSNVHILNANIKATFSTDGTLYGAHGGNIKDCKLDLTGSGASQTIYGAWGCDEVNNCEIVMNGGAYGLYSCTKAITNKITMDAGVCIRATGKQLLLGNFVNRSINADSTVTNIGTVIM